VSCYFAPANNSGSFSTNFVYNLGTGGPAGNSNPNNNFYNYGDFNFGTPAIGSFIYTPLGEIGGNENGSEYPYADDGTPGLEVDPSTANGAEDSSTPVLLSGGIIYQEYQSTTPWPVVRDVMGWQQFVKFDNSQCFGLAKQQINKLNFTVSGWSSSSTLIFKSYNESGTTQVNLSETKKGITYVNQALQAGIPVLIGVDYAPGYPPGNQDHTTDHFVVIVGAGTDANGKFYRFYDNGTDQIGRGTNPDNKLYYNDSTGLISGHTHVGKLSGFTYKVTQIRKSIPK
jgi:hypothetical protein